MKPTTYINWDGLKDIPFFYCDTKEDEENKDFDIYYQGKLVLHDYNHCGHYLYTAALLFSKIRNITADWVNLHNLWILRDCVRENYNHGIGVDDLIFGENFDGKAVLAVLEGFMNEVKTSLGKEENVYLRGFGSFIVKKRAQKTARNISKNTTMIIPAHNIPAFKPSDEFLKMVKQQNA